MKNYQEAEDIQLVYSGDDYFRVLEEIINGSRETLHLQTYIFESDETGLHIAEALIRASARKVKVYMLLDAYGSHSFSKETAKNLVSAGIHFRLFSPLFSTESAYFGRRLHHKIIVADKKIALTGGINIANKYSGEEGASPWLDYAILTRGPVCEYLHLVCDLFYKKHNSRQLTEFEQKSPASITSDNLIRFRRNDWMKGKNEIYKSYVEAIINARESITIVASYFLPGTTLRKLLRDAAARGVEINIIIAGKSDIASVYLAEHFMFDFYLRHKIRIFEWTNSVMHGKAMIVDNKWATVGSYNLNFLSHYISVELNTDILDRKFVGQFAGHLREIMENNCSVINVKVQDRKRSVFRQFKMWFAYQFYRVLMHAMMAGRKHKKRNIRTWIR